MAIQQGTSIGFGGEETVIVDLDLDEVASLLNTALRKRTLLEFSDDKGSRIIINPYQVMVLQAVDNRKAGDGDQASED